MQNKSLPLKVSAILSHMQSHNIYICIFYIQQMFSCCILNFKSVSYHNEHYTQVLVFEFIVEILKSDRASSSVILLSNFI